MKDIIIFFEGMHVVFNPRPVSPFFVFSCKVQHISSELLPLGG